MSATPNGGRAKTLRNRHDRRDSPPTYVVTARMPSPSEPNSSSRWTTGSESSASSGAGARAVVGGWSVTGPTYPGARAASRRAVRARPDVEAVPHRPEGRQRGVELLGRGVEDDVVDAAVLLEDEQLQ